MKKLLLFGLALGVAFGGYSQKVFKSDKELAKNRTETSADFTFKNQTSDFQPNAVEFKSGKDIVLDRYEAGKSGNIYSVLTSYQRPMAYDNASGTFLVTHRADPATYPDANSTGTMMAHLSSDGGESWNHVMTLNPEAGGTYALRYPSGVIYNPTASSNVEDIYAVQSGPSHDDGVWAHTFFTVSQSTGDNQSNFYYAWEGGEENDWARSSMTEVGDAVYNHGQNYITVGSLGADQTLKQYVGTTDDAANGFDWEYNAVTPDWLEDPEDGHSVALYTNWAAWSNDGSIGYMWLVGVSNDSYDYGVYQPQIYYTEDGGDSWDEIELDLEDNATLIEFLPPWQDANGNDGTVRPSFLTADRTYPGVVDYTGKLHLFSNVFGSSRGDVLDPDNGYWITGDVTGGHIFDFVIDMDGIQDVIFVDSIMTDETTADAFGDLGWGHRLQASKSVDEKVIFAVWNDTPEAADGTVRNPDVFAWGYSTETGIASDPINFTADDLYSGFYFYMFVSETTPMVNGFYNIPLTTTLTPSEFAGNDPLAACTHTFVSGVGFGEETFIGVDDHLVAQEGNVTVSQNQPNPFNGETTIEVSTQTATPVMVEVSNIMGQTIYSVNAGTINGNKTISLNSENMESGVYFYTVRIGSESITKKMVVK
ncbi:MAG: T9SS type A sorting domain-containing protein [Bacteroidales bacterium]|nr:T9SS type A sorting domain-containing protein [Bacteroidales bacterium]